MSNKTKAMIASYLRSVLAAASALYLAGVTDPLDLLWSLVAAVAPVLIRYINPNDAGFGVTPKAEEVKEALTKATPKKAPVAKKPTTKK
jgi:hypothetical protein